MTPKHYFDPQRITDLEIKISYLEHQLDQIDKVVIAQAAHIDRLHSQLERLTYQQRQSDPGAFRSLRDELPPHY